MFNFIRRQLLLYKLHRNFAIFEDKVKDLDIYFLKYLYDKLYALFYGSNIAYTNDGIKLFLDYDTFQLFKISNDIGLLESAKKEEISIKDAIELIINDIKQCSKKAKDKELNRFKFEKQLKNII